MKKVLALITIAIISSSLWAQVPTAGLMAHYPLDGDGTDLGPYNAFADTVSNGAPNVPVPATDRFGMAGKAMLFGNNNYLMTSPAPTSLFSAQMINAFTMAGWIKPVNFLSAACNCNPITSIQNATGGVQEEFFAETNDSSYQSIFYFDYYSGITFSPSNGIVWDTSQWAHLAITKYDSLVSYYVNGSLIGTGFIASVQPSYAQSSLYIGASPWGASEFTNAYLDDIYLYNRALSASEINALVNATTGIETYSSIPKINIYPNPSHSTLIIDLSPSIQDTQIKLYDIAGQLVLSQVHNTSSVHLDISGIAEGIYTVCIEGNGNSIHKQFIKQ